MDICNVEYVQMCSFINLTPNIVLPWTTSLLDLVKVTRQLRNMICVSKQAEGRWQRNWRTLAAVELNVGKIFQNYIIILII